MSNIPRYRIVTLIVLVITLSEANSAGGGVESSTNLPKSYVDALGDQTGKQIDNGFVFVDGKYIDKPYRVGRYGTAIRINDVLVRRYDVRWRLWEASELRVDEDPGIPPTLSRASTLDDLDDGEHPLEGARSRKWRYLKQHFPLEEARDKMVEWYRSLPFVRSVQAWRPPDHSIIKVTTVHGKAQLISVGAKKRGGRDVATPEGFVRWLEARRKHLEDELAKGNVVFLVGKGAQISLTRRKAVQVLPAIVQALSSDMTDDKKLDVLELWDVIPPDRKCYLPLVRDFRGSQQLSDRIQQLLKKYPRRPRPVSYRERKEIEKKVLKMPGTPEQKRQMMRKLLEEKQKQIIAEFKRAASSQP